MTTALSEKAKALVARPVLANVATVDAEGRPQLTPVWIDFEGDDLAFNTAKGRAKDANLTANPRRRRLRRRSGRPLQRGRGPGHRRGRRGGRRRAHRPAGQEVHGRRHLSDAPARRGPGHLRGPGRQGRDAVESTRPDAPASAPGGARGHQADRPHPAGPPASHGPALHQAADGPGGRGRRPGADAAPGSGGPTRPSTAAGTVPATAGIGPASTGEGVAHPVGAAVDHHGVGQARPHTSRSPVPAPVRATEEDHEGHPAGLDRCGAVDGVVDVVDPAVEGRVVVLEHRPATSSASASRSASVVDVPSPSRRQHRPTVGDDVDAGHDLGQDRRAPAARPRSATTPRWTRRERTASAPRSEYAS